MTQPIGDNPAMSRDLRPTYAVAAGLLTAMMMNEASNWMVERLHMPLNVDGYGALFAGLVVGAAVAFWPASGAEAGLLCVVRLQIHRQCHRRFPGVRIAFSVNHHRFSLADDRGLSQ